VDLAALRGGRTTWPNDQHRRRTTAPKAPKYGSKVIVNLTPGVCPEIMNCVTLQNTVKQSQLVRSGFFTEEEATL
jgi:hypothetical protein